MSNKDRSKRTTFAEIVAAVAAAPAPAKAGAPIVPGKFSDDVLYDLNGNALHQLRTEGLTLAEVRSAVLAGANVAWDSCGCGGYCNSLVWPDARALRLEAAATEPRLRKKSPATAELLGGDGGDVVLISGDVRWGDLLR